MKTTSYKITTTNSPQKIIVALSGGVDSCVAAWMLKEQGHEVIGVTLRLAPEPQKSCDSSTIVKGNRCCSADDMDDARILCDLIDIPFYAIDSRDRFKAEVFDPFVKNYLNGLTPIPCLACNHIIKFGDLYKTAISLNGKLATGHYAQVVDYHGQKTLARPFDMSRDQTYYLYGTSREVIENLYLPLGPIDKPLVRKIAHELGIKVANKPDSQEICFVPGGDYASVVKKASGKKIPTGDIVDIEGKKIASHSGIHNFTIGQRRGIGVGTGTKQYVADLDPKSNLVRIGNKKNLLCSKIKASQLNQIIDKALWPKKVLVQIRARHNAQTATWHLKNGDIYFDFADPVEAVALGQAAVIYDGNTLLGGGIITGRLDGAFARTASI